VQPIKMKSRWQSTKKPVRACKQFFGGRSLDGLKKLGTDKVKINFVILFQVKRLHQASRKSVCQRVASS